ncbi:MAG: hypothetical protein HN344_03130 [Gammaproteobacteria bacterium]|jgi:hypothetical protein|nr:hypothetical protein [Gammaproteobacteria bacterium]
MTTIRVLALLTLPLFLSGCFVGETAALIVQAPFEVADIVIPGDLVESTGETLGWFTDAIIPF